jgi:hypothetical protein
MPPAQAAEDKRRPFKPSRRNAAPLRQLSPTVKIDPSSQPGRRGSKLEPFLTPPPAPDSGRQPSPIQTTARFSSSRGVDQAGRPSRIDPMGEAADQRVPNIRAPADAALSKEGLGNCALIRWRLSLDQRWSKAPAGSIRRRFSIARRQVRFGDVSRPSAGRSPGGSIRRRFSIARRARSNFSWSENPAQSSSPWATERGALPLLDSATLTDRRR